MARDILFISHATPEDNEFTIWLASRLEMLGYKIWIDKEKLLGGETFWQVIQNVIKNDTIKFLLVYSGNICDKNGNLKEGINKELAYAESIAKNEKLKDFIIPLHIDKIASYHEFIGANILIHIPFDENWASGLEQLKEKLKKSSVPIEINQNVSSFANWYENNYVTDCAVIEKHEQLYSSWWKISNLPTVIYLYIFRDKNSAERVKEKNNNLPLGLINNILTSFENDLNTTERYDFGEYLIKPERIAIYSIENILQGFEANTFPYYRDVKNHFINLLNSVITKLFLERGLLPYELSNGKAYFFPKGNGFSSVKFTYPNTQKNKKKAIGGIYLDIGYWHYAISIKPILSPIFGYSIKSHIIFTSDGQQIITDSKKQHSYRRNKGRNFFNDSWRDLQLAFIQNLKNSQSLIQTVVKGNNVVIEMKEWPELFDCDFGYNDPKKVTNIDMLDDKSLELTNDEIIEEETDE
jgi:hypothetical protein